MATRAIHSQEQLDVGKRQLGRFSTVEFTTAEEAYFKKETGFSFDELNNLYLNNKQNELALKNKVELTFKKIAADREKNISPQDALNTVKYGSTIFSLGIAQGDSARHSKQMESNISSMLNILNQHNVDYFLLNYPTQFGFYPAANKKIARVAKHKNIPFIDLRTALPEKCQKDPNNCKNLLFYDAHATQQGNRLVAQKIMSHLKKHRL